MPSIGKILHYTEPIGPGIRVDSGVHKDIEISIDYDPIMAKLIVHAPDRRVAIQKMINALNDYKILGVRTSKKYMIDVMSHPEFINGKTFTNFIETNMSDREIDLRKYKEIAATAAALANIQQNNSHSQTFKMNDVAPSPWDLLGSWQIGDSIHE